MHHESTCLLPVVGVDVLVFCLFACCLFGRFCFQSCQVTKVYLQGSSSSASAVELFKLKAKLRDYLLDVEMARSGFDQKDLSQLRKKLENHKSYRTFVSPYPCDDAPAAELTWQSNLKASSLLCLKLVED